MSQMKLGSMITCASVTDGLTKCNPGMVGSSKPIFASSVKQLFQYKSKNPVRKEQFNTRKKINMRFSKIPGHFLGFV